MLKYLEILYITYTDLPSSTPPQNSTRLLQDSTPSSSLPTATSSPGLVHSDPSLSPTTAIAVLVTTAVSGGVVSSSAPVGVAIVVIVETEVGVASPRSFSS